MFYFNPIDIFIKYSRHSDFRHVEKGYLQSGQEPLPAFRHDSTSHIGKLTLVRNFMKQSAR